ncbi:MAG TPA: sigma-70 family RNA polymerase sigma factor [Cellulomonas sp.]
MTSWEQALDALVRERGGALVRYAQLLTGDARDAEDLTQEALVRTFSRGRTSLREPAAVEGYVRRAILNAYLDGYRRRRVWQGVRHLVARAEVVESHDAPTASRTDVGRALALLPPRQRATVVLRFYDDLTVPEIARRLGVSDGAVKRYLHDGVAALETHLGPLDTPGTPDEHEIDLTLTGRQR